MSFHLVPHVPRLVAMVAKKIMCKGKVNNFIFIFYIAPVDYTALLYYQDLIWFMNFLLVPHLPRLIATLQSFFVRKKSKQFDVQFFYFF